MSHFPVSNTEFHPLSRSPDSTRTNPEVLKCLVYCSRAIAPVTQDGVRELLQVSRPRNMAAQVTGVLLHHDGHYLQCLEGPAAAVDMIYASIRRDARHHDLSVLLESPVRWRSFSSWYMAEAELPTAEWLGLYLAPWRPQAGPDAPETYLGIASVLGAWQTCRANPVFGIDPGPPGY